MKRSQQSRNKANKTRNTAGVLSYKKQRNYVVKLDNQCKKDHFDRLNPEKVSKPFWKSKSYFPNKEHGKLENQKLHQGTLHYRPNDVTVIGVRRGEGTQINDKKGHRWEGVHANSGISTKAQKQPSEVLCEVL